MLLCIAYSLSGLRRLNDFKIGNRIGKQKKKDREFRDPYLMERIICRTAAKKRRKEYQSKEQHISSSREQLCLNPFAFFRSSLLEA